MNVGDVVKNLNSESLISGIVVDFEHRRSGGGFYSIRMPVVLWVDGRCNPMWPGWVEKVK